MPVEVPNEPWVNWAGNQALTPFRHCHPQTLEDLVAITQEAEGLGKHVRAVGSSWSFTDVASTGDYLVETDQLRQILTGVLATALNARGSSLQLVHVEAGIKVRDLCDYLDSRNLALSTMGGSDGQSLAGVLSTCVHGMDFDRGPIPDTVRAIHLVGPNGVQYWVEPALGITDFAALGQALGIDQTNIRYDDDWFNAVITSVGSLGIVYSVILEVEAQYDLVQSVVSDTWPTVRADLMNDAPFQVPTTSVQVVVDPAAPHGCFLYSRTKGVATKPVGFRIYNDPLGLFCTTAIADAIVVVPDGAGAFLAAAATLIPLLPPPFDLFFGTLLVTGTGTALTVAPLVALIRALGPGRLGDVIATVLNGNPSLTAQVVTAVTTSSIPLGTRRGFAHTIMSAPDPGECVARGLALEIAFDATNGSHLNFLDEALPLLDQWFTNEGLALAGWFSLRFVGQSKAYLSPQNRCSRTCMVEIVGLRSMSSTVPILDRLESLGRKHGGVQHWGMFRDLTRADVERAYPHLDDWRWIWSQLTREGSLRTFENDFSVRVGLSQAPADPDLSFLSPLLLTEEPLADSSYLAPLLLEGP